MADVVSFIQEAESAGEAQQLPTLEDEERHVRAMNGVVESGIAPSFVLMVSLWYTRHEQLVRSAWWHAFSGGANLVVPVISFGMGKVKSGPLASWQYMYLLAGGLIFLWSFVVLFLLPDNPVSAKDIPNDEKAMILARMKSDNSGTLNRHFKPKQIFECVTSLNFWCVKLMSMLTSVTAGPISSFGSIIFKYMGFSLSNALLLNIPNGGLAFFFILTSAYLGGNIANIRLVLVMFGCPVVVLGAALVWQLSNTNLAGRWAGFYLMNFFSFAYVQVIGLGTSNVAGYTKRTTMAATVFVSYCIGNIIGPLILNNKDAPRYNPGFMGTMICLASCFFIALTLRLYLGRQNAKKETEFGPPENEHGLEDLTDQENLDFRYQL